MRIRPSPLLLAIASLTIAPAVSAAAIEFTYTCTTTGDGGGTQTCTAGTPLAQVQIATTDQAGVLQVSGRATPELVSLWSAGKGGYELQTLLLNFDDALYGSLPSDQQGQRLFNTMQFLFSNGVDTLPTSSDWTSNGVAVHVEDNYSTQSPWHGFDLELDLGQGNVHFPLMSGGAYDTIGFLRSGNAFDLLPTMFQFATENSSAPQHPDTVFQASGGNCLDTAQGLLSSIQLVPSDVGTNGCSGQTNYGPWLGSYARVSPQITVPEPASLLLVGVALAGLGAQRRRRM